MLKKARFIDVWLRGARELRRETSAKTLLLTSPVISVPPKWVLEPSDSSVFKGRTALIDCQADGFPPPSIRWSKTEGTKRLNAIAAN